MKDDNLDKLTDQLRAMGVTRCILHFGDRESRKKCDDEMGERAMRMFRIAMGQEKPTPEEAFKENGERVTYAVSAYESPPEDSFLITRLDDICYRSTSLKGIDLFIEKHPFKLEPQKPKKWWNFKRLKGQILQCVFDKPNS